MNLSLVRESGGDDVPTFPATLYGHRGPELKMSLSGTVYLIIIVHQCANEALRLPNCALGQNK